MKFGMLAALTVLAAGFFVLEAPAQVMVPPTGPVVASSSQMVQPARTGLFSRLRNRRTMSNTSMTTMTPAPVMQTSSATPTTAATIVQAGATTTTPANILPAVGSTTTPAATTMPATVMTQQQMSQPSQGGLFARLRARMGR